MRPSPSTSPAPLARSMLTDGVLHGPLRTAGWAVVLGALGWASLGSPARAVAQDLGGVQDLGGITGLWAAPAGQARRVSSGSHNLQGQDDFKVIAPGAELTIAELTGPGCITHLWFTLDSLDPAVARRVVLRMFWDGERRPSVEVPIGDFFAVGHGLDRDVRSVPVRVQGDGRARSCYWPMPFNGAALVGLRNDSGFPVRLVSYHIDWRRLDAPLPEPVRTFHASYAQGPGEAGEWVLADIHGRGHYVGTVVSLDSAEEGWPGEGDDRFYVDGAETPTLQGTGLEQYFGDGWALREDHGPFAGVSVYEGTEAGARLTAYRWHVPDALPFETGLKVAFETAGWALRDGAWRIVDDRRDQWSGVAMWYQEEPHGPRQDLPPGDRRLAYFEQRLEGEDATDHWQHPPRSQLVVETGELWAFGGHARFVPETLEGARLEVPLEIEVARDYDLAARFTLTRDGGVYEVWLDGAPLAGPFDLYSLHTRLAEKRLGRRFLSEGTHVLSLRGTGRHLESRGLAVGVDSIMLRWPRP